MTDILDPEDCTTMAEVRAGVDDIDRKLVALLARRFGYMDAAARIKPDRSVVRDEARKAEVRHLALAALTVLAGAVFALIDGTLGAAPDVLPHAAVDLVLRLVALGHRVLILVQV
jgi:isochorismate pyruvate lyase